jgi:hypothetical protein
MRHELAQVLLSIHLGGALAAVLLAAVLRMAGT